MSTVRGATLLGPERLEIREYPVPEVADDGELLRVGLGGVCGTDVKYFHGRIDMPYPVILGHEIFGRVERLGRAAARIHGVAEGDRVILKGSRGCSHCRDCRDGAPRFCSQRTLYGSATSAEHPPHLFGGPAVDVPRRAGRDRPHGGRDGPQRRRRQVRPPPPQPRHRRDLRPPRPPPDPPPALTPAENARESGPTQVGFSVPPYARDGLTNGNRDKAIGTSIGCSLPSHLKNTV